MTIRILMPRESCNRILGILNGGLTFLEGFAEVYGFINHGLLLL
jgi:hypothetical protein